MLQPAKLAAAVRSEGGVSRRLFLAYGAALASLPQLALRAVAADKKIVFPSDPFTLGVASGDPEPDGVVLWTRLAPRPLEPEGGMTREPVAVAWEVADDEGFKTIVSQGTATASPQLGHSVHVEARGLLPDRWYWYRFRAGDAVSPIGRTRTMPAADAAPGKLRLAFASCQHYESGLFTGYEQMARDELDLVFHLGDYIYEYPPKDATPQNKLVRKHVGNATSKIQSLDDYRIRHAQYRSDPLLHGMHAQCPWFVTWDDHEFDDNCAGDICARPGIDPLAHLMQRANAYQAYYEMMPLRARSIPRGPDMTLYRKASFGRLAEFMILDTRQYRTDQPNKDGSKPLNEEALNPNNSLLGAKQRAWLNDQLIASPGRWNVLAQQVMMGMVGTPVPDGESRYSMDQWPGAAHERMDLMKFIAERKISNPVVLTGDIHSNWANDLRIDDRQPELPVTATEYVCTSLSSGGNGTEKSKNQDALLAANPCIRFHNRERGYVRCEITDKTWTSEFVVIDDVLKPGGKCFVRQAFVTENGKPGANRV